MKLKLNKKHMKSLSANSQIAANQTPEVAGAGSRAACSLRCDTRRGGCTESYGCPSDGPLCQTIQCL